MNPVGLSPRLATIIRKYALELISSPCELGDGKGRGRLGEKMLLEIDRLSKAMDTIQAALVNAPTATTGQCPHWLSNAISDLISFSLSH